MNLDLLIKDALRENRVVGWTGQIFYGNVFYLNDKLVAKEGKDRWRAANEELVGRMLYASGISVPQMHEVVKFTDLKMYYVVMERLNATAICNLPHDKKMEGHFKQQYELERAKKLGFVPPADAAYDVNAMMNASGKLWLIDFAHWRIPT